MHLVSDLPTVPLQLFIPGKDFDWFLQSLLFSSAAIRKKSAENREMTL